MQQLLTFMNYMKKYCKVTLEKEELLQFRCSAVKTIPAIDYGDIAENQWY